MRCKQHICHSDRLIPRGKYGYQIAWLLSRLLVLEDEVLDSLRKAGATKKKAYKLLAKLYRDQAQLMSNEAEDYGWPAPLFPSRRAST
jgi:hypothetical protein